MPPISQQHVPNSELDLILFSIPQFVLLQMGAASMLIALAAQKAAAQTLKTVGEASEEIFLGDRLPILNFPQDGE